jgi:hypothetical protein
MKYFAIIVIFFPAVVFGLTNFYTTYDGTLSVRVTVSDATVNAFRGSLFIDAEVKNINTARSVVAHWVELEQKKTLNGSRIDFTGIIPGGYSQSLTSDSFNDSNILFDIVTDAEEVTLRFGEDTVSLLHEVEPSVDEVMLDSRTHKQSLDNIDFDKDVAQPVFNQHGIIQDDTQTLLYFQVSDKKSGVKKVELYKDGEWREVTSPIHIHKARYRLRAIDNVGNIAYASSEDDQSPVYLYLGICIILLISLMLSYKYLVKKSILQFFIKSFACACKRLFCWINSDD